MCELVLEIGYNHHGSVGLLREMLAHSALLTDKITLQYRTEEFNKDWQIEVGTLIEEANICKKRHPGLEIGMAIDGPEGLEVARRSFDFCKILAVACQAPWLTGEALLNRKPVWVSMGLNSFKKIPESHVLRLNGEHVWPVYTSFDADGSDISKVEIEDLGSNAQFIGYGNHQRNIAYLLAVQGECKIDAIFNYVSLVTEKDINPDGGHSLTFDEVRFLKDVLKAKNEIRSRPVRMEWKAFEAKA